MKLPRVRFLSWTKRRRWLPIRVMRVGGYQWHAGEGEPQYWGRIFSIEMGDHAFQVSVQMRDVLPHELDHSAGSVTSLYELQPCDKCTKETTPRGVSFRKVYYRCLHCGTRSEKWKSELQNRVDD